VSVEKFTRQFLQADEEGRLETRESPLAGESGVEGLESRVCCGCSCLCDDISYHMRQGQVVRSLNLCEFGRKRLQDASAARQGADSALTEGLVEDSLDKAAQILRTHGPVLFVGAEFLDEKAQQASVRLAKAVGGIWVPWAFEAVRRFHQVACQRGWAAALLDDIRDHGEVVIFWRCDPLVTHHRHLSRYSFFARGRFTERGHHDRTLAAVGEKGQRIERLCKQFLDVPPDRDRALAESLRRGRAQEGFEHRDFEGIRRACEQSGYIAIFVDPEALDPGTLETIFFWAAETNQAGGARRVVILPLYRTGPNLEGFCQVSTAACGAPWGADFREWRGPARTKGLAGSGGPGRLRVSFVSSGQGGVQAAACRDCRQTEHRAGPLFAQPAGSAGRDDSGRAWRFWGRGGVFPGRRRSPSGVWPAGPSADWVEVGRRGAGISDHEDALKWESRSDRKGRRF
jgi:hypothetical protein